jgi:molybdopterin-guanine dinucleotide biosynthesis protein A
VDTALILAGGESRRFGRPKALVEFAGRPLIAHVSVAVASLVDETIVSVAGSESERRIRSVLPDALFVRDERSGRGPVEGFRQGFRVAHGERVLVAPCDAPLLRPALYQLLLDALGGHDAAVPKFDVFDPVRAVYKRSSVLKSLDTSPTIRSPSTLVDHLQTVFLGPDRIRQVDADFSSFLDVNTRSDLDEAFRRKRSSDG